MSQKTRRAQLNFKLRLLTAAPYTTHCSDTVRVSVQSTDITFIQSSSPSLSPQRDQNLITTTNILANTKAIGVFSAGSGFTVLSVRWDLPHKQTYCFIAVKKGEKCRLSSFCYCSVFSQLCLCVCVCVCVDDCELITD